MHLVDSFLGSDCVQGTTAVCGLAHGGGGWYEYQRWLGEGRVSVLLTETGCMA